MKHDESPQDLRYLLSRVQTLEDSEAVHLNRVRQLNLIVQDLRLVCARLQEQVDLQRLSLKLTDMEVDRLQGIEELPAINLGATLGQPVDMHPLDICYYESA